MTKKILIFGKSGQVSSNLLKFFSTEEGFEITSVSSAQVDFSNLKNLDSFLENLAKKPDIVINCAAYTNVDKAEDERELCDIINHKAVAKIAQFCQKNHIIFIHYSTDYVFNGHGKLPFKTNNSKDLHPLNHYGVTKLLAEKAIIKSLCKYIIFRVSWIYDLDEKHKNFYNTIKKLAKEKEVLSIIDDQIGSPTRADFIAKNTIKIIKDLPQNSEKYLNKIFHLNNGRFISWYDFAVEIVKELRSKNEILAVKEIKKIKSQDYKTKAARPLNSRLYPSFFCLAKANILQIIFCDILARIKKELVKLVNKTCYYFRILILSKIHKYRNFILLKLNLKKPLNIRLGVSYNVFDSEELLEGSIKQIRSLASYVSVVYQKKSNFGYDCNPDLLEVLNNLKEKKLIDEIVEYQPNLLVKSVVNEVNKRNIGLELSRKNNCTHHISLDCDEYYVTKDFKNIINDIAIKDHEATFCQMQTYYKSWKYKYAVAEEYYVPLIFKIKNGVNYKLGELCVVSCDPTRSMKLSNFKIYKRSEIEMHHGSYIRKNIAQKLINSSAAGNYNSEIEVITKHYQKWEEGFDAYVAGAPCKMLKLTKIDQLFDDYE